MENFHWKYCLNEEQFTKLYRIICKIPGLLQYLTDHNGRELTSIITSFKMLIESEGTSTSGIRTNLELIIKKFDLFRKEFEDKNIEQKEFDLYHVLTWNPKPKWTNNMTVEEIDYLDHFIPKVPGLSSYLLNNINKENLYDLIVVFQLQLNATGINNADIDFLLETIKERFYRIMDDHKEAIHYVNHSHQINDIRLLDDFRTEAADSFYSLDAQDERCTDFANKYLRTFHPYIASELFQKFFRANKVNVALRFAHQEFNHIFSSPNIYWHNKEAIFGCVNILHNILEALGQKGMNQLLVLSPKLHNVFLETLYLLLSRTIYWTDKETDKDEKYDDTRLPINVQHKLRAYRLRASLVELYGEQLVSNIIDADINKMSLADLYSAHFMAYVHKIVGNESIYKRDAIRLFHSKKIFESSSPERASEDGFLMNDELAMAIHKKYKEGKYSLPQKDISELNLFLRKYFKEEEKIAIQNDEPISYLKRDHFSPSFKANKDEIRSYLQSNGIEYLYHFTEKDRLESIIKYGGLLSFKRCLDESITMPVREDMALTRDIDARMDLEDFVRTSFCSRLPKIKERQAEGAELILLKIDPEVALFDDTLYTDIEATQPNLKCGGEFDDLKRVNIQATKKPFAKPEDNDYWQRQAEVLIKGFIPLKYILNVNSPEILS